MTTHRMPKPEQHGRFGLGDKWPWLVVLGFSFLVTVGLLLWQISAYLTEAPAPTPIAESTLPGVIREPQVQIAPAAGLPGTTVTVWGRGWQANDRLAISLDDLGSSAAPQTQAEVRVNANGEFLTSFAFPTDQLWRSLPDIGLIVASRTNEDVVSVTFKLLTATPAPPTTVPATSTPSPTAVPPTPTATITAVPPTPTLPCLYSMRFVADVTIPDDTVILPGTGFLKTWRIRNNGTCPWPVGASWVFAGGSQMSGPASVPVPVTNPGETADVSIYLIAPSSPGTYTGFWTVRLPEGRILTQRYYVRITVPSPTATPAPPTPTPSSTPIQPTPIIYSWRGEYFGNPNLTGSPTLVRDDDTINFNWGSGSPALGLPVDNFSVRWTRNLYFEGGVYRFYAFSDDGIRLWIDNNLVLDEWRSASDETFTRDVTLTSGNHLIRLEYYEALGAAQVQAWWQQAGYYPDWRGEYWANRSLTGPFTLVRNDVDVNFNWAAGAPAPQLPADNFSARWTRSLFLGDGHYRFHAAMDDGLRFYIDDTLLIDEWQDGGRREVSKDTWLATGIHELRIEYYEYVGDASVRLWWEPLAGLPDWRGEYWANKTLSGAPTFVRNDRELSFDWGLSAPAPGLPADEFSARWTRVLIFIPGTYRFTVSADDGVRVYVDGQRIIDEWHLSAGSQTYTADIALTGQHTLVVEFYEEQIDASIDFSYGRIKD